MKHISSILLGCTALLSFAACSDSDYTDRYLDPSKTTTVSCEKLMTGIFKAGNDYTYATYYRLWSFDNGLIARFAQTLGFTNSDGRYLASDGYINDRWVNFYKIIAQYRILEKTYNELPDVKKADYEPTLLISKIFMYDHMQQLVDMWGDIPFKEAGYLGITGDIAGSYPSYDKAEDLYKMMMSDLKEVNTKIAGLNSLSTLTLSYLKAQDYINGGDLGIWRKYANALRLRMAMRVADHGSLAEEGKAVISEILSDPATYPLLEDNKEFIRVASDNDGFKAEKHVRDGFETSGRGLASYEVISRLKGDPRLDILYAKNKEGNYEGLNTHDDYSKQQPLYERPLAQGGNFYSAVDTATVSRNNDYPGIILMPSEVEFIKAEAYQKGYASGNAKEAFESGIAKSIEFCYNLNAKATFSDPTPSPSKAEIAVYATKLWNDASDKLVAIQTQKWLSFGYFQPIQAWNEIRRTGVPALYFQKDVTSSICQEIPNRLRYPISERNNNPKYQTMQSDDTYYRKMFWAK
ncbi:MAG: SusD/RagB family nutrient-binding outer membrane lipoprotein [Tannerellaceae bacterium]